MISIDDLLNPLARETAGAALAGTLRGIVTGAIQGVFFIAFISAGLALLVSFLTPGGSLIQPAGPSGAAGKPLSSGASGSN
jgi:hypothetical protein